MCVADARARPKLQKWKVSSFAWDLQLRQIYHSLSNSLIDSIYQYTSPSWESLLNKFLSAYSDTNCSATNNYSHF